MNNYLSFNPQYVLKPDEGRALIMSAILGRDSYDYIEDTFSTFIHPIYAMIFCFMDGRSYKECIGTASEYLNVKTEEVEKLIYSIADNPNYVKMESKCGTSVFPPYTIVSSKTSNLLHRFDPEMFQYTTIDLRFKRHLTPSTITLMVNNTCVTNCVYCYEDKSKKISCQIPLNRIIELIHEAKSLHVRTFDVIGGEFFLYKYWREVLYELAKNGYFPYLSTKMPLNENIVKELSKLKIHDIQISLDSLIEEHLVKSLCVGKGYVEKIKNCLLCLNKYDIHVMIHTVLSKYNNTIEDIASIYDFIQGMDNITEWKIVKAEPSIYTKAEYRLIQINDDTLSEIIEYIKTIRQNNHFPIIAPIVLSESKKQDKRSFFGRNFCSGNYNSIYILPDGQVTICEQLYWNKQFIIGNVIKENIIDIWNSDKAKSLFYIKQNNIPEDSLCHFCSDFVKCRSLKQVCYRDIIKKYGEKKWYYPDANCPYSNSMIKNLQLAR